MPDAPQFELVGPPCEIGGCSGVLVDSLRLADHWFFRKCSKCGAESGGMSAVDKFAWARRVIERALTGEREN